MKYLQASCLPEGFDITRESWPGSWSISRFYGFEFMISPETIKADTLDYWAPSAEDLEANDWTAFYTGGE